MVQKIIAIKLAYSKDHGCIEYGAKSNEYLVIFEDTKKVYIVRASFKFLSCNVCKNDMSMPSSLLSQIFFGS